MGRELYADIIQSLGRWLREYIQYGPGDRPRARGSEERVGGWMQDVSLELRVAWSKLWDE